MSGCRWAVLTGGEPALQVDAALAAALRAAGYWLAVETNGTVPLPPDLDWVCVSPKTAEHTLRVLHANEVKYVRRHGQAIPRPTVEARHYLISPAFGPDGLRREDLDWCVNLVRDNPRWRLSVQLHKFIGVR